MTRSAGQYAQLIELCRARGCSYEDAREMVQEAHLRLLDYQRSTTVRDPDSLLRRIVINLSINYYHRALPRLLTSQSIDELDRRGLLIACSPSPERILASEQELGGVISLLNALSPRTCQIFIAQRSGYTYEEIAKAFSVRPRTVEKHVASAALALTEMIAEI